MKNLIIIIFYSLTSNLVAQDATIINIIASDKCHKSTKFLIYANEERLGTIQRSENIEYKMYSEGRVEFSIIMGSNVRIPILLDVENGNNYYIEINNYGWFPKYGEVDEQKGLDLLSNSSKTFKVEEDINNPIADLPQGSNIKGGQATCFVISKNGYLITNHHVIDGATQIMVSGIDGDFVTQYAASLVASDPSNDLALIKVNNKYINFEEIPYGLRSQGVEQGEAIYTLGYPLSFAMGDEIKLTDGIISAKSGVQGDVSKYQISAAVQPGNSGGPLIDESGNILGVIYAKSTIADAASYATKSGYLKLFLDNVDDIEIPEVSQDDQKSFTDVISKVKNFVFIVKTK